MIQRFQYVLGSIGFGLLLPAASWAFTAELVSLSPEATDISEMVTGAPSNVVIGAWQGLTEDTEYTAVFTADESPAGVITPGGDLSLDTPWEYDATTGTVTVTFTATGIKSTNEDMPSDVGMVALVGAVAEGEDGPPVEMTGFWLATNVQDWELIPPSPEQDTPAFGYSLTGPAGETGFLHMYMPDGIKDLLSEYSGQDLEWDDMALFTGDSQSSLSITEVEGGAYIDINVTFASASTTVSASSTSVTKEFTVQEQLPVSLAASKTSLKKNKEFDLYGWVRNGKKGEEVTVWRKQAGEDSYTKIDTLTISKKGYYSETYTATKTARYKVKYRKSGNVRSSSVTKVTVN